jgi:hypothetical protein
MEDVERAASTTTNKAVKAVMNGLAFFMRSTEVYNRRVAALSFYRMMKDHNNGRWTEAEIYDKIEEFIDKTQWWYGPENYPAVARGGTMLARAAGVLYTFRPFAHNYALSLVHSFIVNGGTNGAIYVGRSLAWLVIIAGVGALPFFDDILDILEKRYKIPFRQHARDNIRKSLGGDIERLYSAGLFGLGPQMDLGASIRPIQLPQWDKLGESVWGVYGGLAKKIVAAAEAGNAGEWMRLTENISPVVLESILKAIRLHSEGVTTAAGLHVYGPDNKPFKFDVFETGLQAASIKPYRYGKLQEERRQMTVIKQALEEDKKTLLERARRTGTDKERANVRSDMREFTRGIPIDFKGIVSPPEWPKDKIDKGMLRFWKTTGSSAIPEP